MARTQTPARTRASSGIDIAFLLSSMAFRLRRILPAYASTPGSGARPRVEIAET
jgi:hypothetical protein